MATSVTAQWWHTDNDADWGKSYDEAVATMSSVFAGHHSLALQQTMFAMGEAMIARQPEIGEVRFSLPNKHHFVIDLSPFGLENPNEVFHADDRPVRLHRGHHPPRRRPRPRSGLRPGPGLVRHDDEQSNDELRELDALPREAAVERFLSICRSRRWAESMAASRPFGDTARLQDRPTRSGWASARTTGWRHWRVIPGSARREVPRRSTRGRSRRACGRRPLPCRRRSADGNRRYEERFGHIFLISAAGRGPRRSSAS